MCSKSLTFTYSADETRRVGQRLGEVLKPGKTLLVRGELGSGKTVFVQGVAMGLGVPDGYYVTSPSYTLINEYPGRCRLFHADLYRLNDISDLEHLGLDDILGGDGVVAIEWPERLPGNFLSPDIEVAITIIDDDEREISITGSEC